MPKSFAKVHKHVHKKKGSSAARMTTLHADSRDSRSLLRAANRDAKVARTEAVRAKMNQPFVERLEFIRERLGVDAVGWEQGKDEQQQRQCCTLPEMQDVIHAWIHRHDDELASLQASRRAGRPRSPREELLLQLQQTGEQEYVSGFWVPDLLSDVGNVKAFGEWKGAWSGLNTVKFVRVSKGGRVSESAWPPKGNS